MTNDNEKSPMITEMIDILKTVTLTNNPTAKYINKHDLLEMLSMCHIKNKSFERFICNHLSVDTLPSKPTPKRLMRYVKNHHTFLDKEVGLSDDVKKFCRVYSEKIDNKILKLPNFFDIDTVSQTNSIYKDLYHHLYHTSHLPTALSHDIAKNLSLQLTSEHIGSTHLSLHGTPYDNIHHIADEIALTLQNFGYDNVVHLDCSRFDGQAEKFVFCGSQSVWSGSRAGILTEAVFKNPKTVIILYNIDKPNPEITYCLLSAWQQGIMIDEYGLKKSSDDNRNSSKEPTIVDFKDVVFITTNTLCSEEYNRKTFQKQLVENPALAKSTLIDKLQRSTRLMRGSTIHCYDPSVLIELSKNWIMVNPHQWQHKIVNKNKQLGCALQAELLKWGMEGVEIEELDLSIFTNIFLLNAELIQQTPNDWAKFIINPLVDKLLTSDEHQHELTITVHVDVPAVVEKFLAKVGDSEPQSSMFKRGIHLVPTITCKDWTIELSAVVEMPIPNNKIMDEENTIRLQIDYPDIGFADVKGHEPIKNYLNDIHYYLKNYQELQQLHITMPKGVLLYGRAGTGKTMLAKALAGEAKLPFIAVTGSELLHSSNMSEFLKIADSVSPCVIFIDEADGLGSRDESSVHANAINQLLPFIEGFHTDAEHSRFFILASNYPDKIDKALLRAGRIEDRFEVGNLDDDGRKPFIDNILPYYDSSVHQDFALLLTDDFNGSEMSRLHRVSVLQHLKNNKQLLTKKQFIELSQQIQLNLSSYNVITPPKRVVAVHEIGHALLHHHYGFSKINYISLVGSDDVGGYVSLSIADNESWRKTKVKQRLACYLGGYASEMVIFGEPSTGAINDLEKATKQAWVCISEAGLDEASGLLNMTLIYDNKQIANNAIDEKRLMICEQWLQDAKQQAIEIISKNKDLVNYLTDYLMAERILEGERFQQLIQQYHMGAVA